MNKEDNWLASGEQSEITPNIKSISANELHGNSFERIQSIFNWMKSNLNVLSNEGNEWKKYFRNRTADEIINSKNSSGCGDNAVVFCVLSRASGIPAIFVELPYKEWLENELDGKWTNHDLVKVYFDNKWHWVDPTRRNIGDSPKEVGGGVEYVVLDEGLDSWDIGIKDWESYKTKYLDFREKYLSNIIH